MIIRRGVRRDQNLNRKGVKGVEADAAALAGPGLTVLVIERDGYDIVTAKWLARVEPADRDMLVIDPLNGVVCSSE